MKYRIRVLRDVTMSADIDVTATTRDEAENLALDIAGSGDGDIAWAENESGCTTVIAVTEYPR